MDDSSRQSGFSECDSNASHPDDPSRCDPDSASQDAVIIDEESMSCDISDQAKPHTDDGKEKNFTPCRPPRSAAFLTDNTKIKGCVARRVIRVTPEFGKPGKSENRGIPEMALVTHLSVMHSRNK